jgi:hypothetical protein
LSAALCLAPLLNLDRKEFKKLDLVIGDSVMFEDFDIRSSSTSPGLRELDGYEFALMLMR